MHDSYQDSCSIYVVSEYLNGGDLYSQIIKKPIASENRVASIASQILTALSYCHSKNIVHRDIKPQNIMFQSTAHDTIKLIDFGFAKYYKKETCMKDKLGSPLFMAPEMIKDQPYNEKVDIWGTGMVVYMMLSGNFPFPTVDVEQIFASVTSLKLTYDSFPTHFSPDVRNFLLSMLNSDPVQRLSACELLKHPWILKKEEKKPSFSAEIVKNLKANASRLYGRSILQDSIFTYLAINATKISLEKQIQELFVLLDTNKDGRITIDEFTYGLKYLPINMPISPLGLEKIFNSIDTNKNGSIEYTEFIKALINFNELTTTENIKVAFNYFDLDGNGFITADELKPLLKASLSCNSGTQVLNELIQEIDKNSDGKISFEELKKILKMKT